MKETTRQAFERKYPKPLSIYWNEKAERYDPYDEKNCKSEMAASEYHFAFQIWSRAIESQQTRINELEQWIEAATKDDMPVPDWLKSSARSLLGGGQ